MKKLKVIGILVMLIAAGIFVCKSTMAVVPPHWEYDLTILPEYSLQLFINQSPYESISSIGYDKNQIETSRTFHGVVYGIIDEISIKNNGISNLTNVVVYSQRELIEVIPILGINETFFIESLHRNNIEILTEQGVYAEIYSVSSHSGSYQTFEFNGYTLFFILLFLISIFSGIFFGFQYKKKKKKIYLIAVILMIILAVIFLLISYFAGITYLAAYS